MFVCSYKNKVAENKLVAWVEIRIISFEFPRYQCNY